MKKVECFFRVVVIEIIKEEVRSVLLLVRIQYFYGVSGVVDVGLYSYFEINFLCLVERNIVIEGMGQVEGVILEECLYVIGFNLVT